MIYIGAFYNVLRGEEKPWIRWPHSALVQADWLAGTPATGAHALPVTNQFVEITAAHMTVQLPTTNQPSRRLVADTNAVILSPADKSRATSDQVVYDESAGKVQLSGHAVWQADQRLVKGDVLVFDRTNRVLTATRNAYLKMPLSSVGRPSSPGGTRQEPPLETVEVFSDDFVYAPEALTFHEHVQANYLIGESLRGSLACAVLDVAFRSNRVESLLASKNVAAEQPSFGTNATRLSRKLNCESLTVRFGSNGNIQNIIARTNVLAQQTETRRGRPLPIHTELSAGSASISFFPHTNQVREFVAEKDVFISQDSRSARGAMAVYTASNDSVELSGNPTAETPMGRITQARALIWDRGRNTLKARGTRVIGQSEAPLKGTNTSRLLRK